MPVIHSSRLGQVTVPDDHVLTFPNGLPSFETLTDWALITNVPDSPFMWLHSLHDDQVALPVCDPQAFFADYELAVHPDDLAEIAAGDGDLVEAVAVVVARGAIDQFTINLAAPIVVNATSRRGAQVVNTASDDYKVRTPLLEGMGGTLRLVSPGHPGLPVVVVAEAS